MGLQSAWIKQVITQAKLNNMTLIGELGTVLAGLSPVKGQEVVAYDTSGGFTQWHEYIWDGVSAWKDVTLPIHKHTATNDGGILIDILQQNPQIQDYFELLSNFNDWLYVTSGTGAATNWHDNAGDLARRYQTGTTSTGYAQGRKGGVYYPNYAATLLFNWVWQLSAVNNLFFLLGLNMEDPNAAQNNNRKIGIEWCDGQPAANYFVTSASGSARSSSDSTVAITTTVDGVKMLFTPAAQASFKFDAGPTTINKSTNLPTTNGTGNDALREGIKNNNGGVVNRDLRILGLRVLGTPGIGQWVT